MRVLKGIHLKHRLRTGAQVLLLAAGLFVWHPKALPPSSPTFDAGAVMRQVHFAWRHEAAVWTSRHDTWSATVERGGLSLTPAQGQPVRFAAAVVSLGPSPLGSERGHEHHSDRGGLRIDRDAFVEEFESAEDGVEQRWRFRALPPGDGALEVRIRLLSGGLEAATSSGLHFSAGPLMVRYGHATWVDADGRRTAVPARFEDGAIALSVSAETLRSSVFPALLDPLIGPEFGIDVPVTGAAAWDQEEPALACGAGTCLVVWQDERIADDAIDLFGARVSPSGAVLDVAGLAISTAPLDQTRPAAAWDGTNFLVTWTSGPSGGGADIVGTRVSPAGAVLDGNGLPISTGLGDQQDSTIAWDGTNFLVAWADTRIGEPRIRAARVSPGGVVLEPDGLALSTSASLQQFPDVACSPTSCLVAWEDVVSATGADDIHGVRVSGSGTVVDPQDLVISTAASRQQSASVAWNGTDFFVTWDDARDGPSDIYGSRVSGATGAVLDVNGLAISTQGARQTEPDVACDGTACLVTWVDYRARTAIYGARVTSAGAVLDPAGISISTTAVNHLSPAVAWAGTNYLAAWSTSVPFGPSSWDISAARVSPAGSLLDLTTLAVSTAANQQRAPAVAWNGTSYLFVWSDLRRGIDWDLFGARVSEDGTVLDPAGLPISTAVSDQEAPAVASNGTDFLVTWSDARSSRLGVYATRVTAAGTVLDTNGIAISPGTFDNHSQPALAWNGTNYFVTWTGAGVTGARVSASGVVLDPNGVVIAPRGRAPAVACDGTNCLVAWGDYRALNEDIYASRVSAAGTLLDGTGLAIATAPRHEYAPAIASSGTSYLVTWTEDTAGGDIAGAVIDSEGVQIATGLALSTAPGAQRFPAVSWDGASYLVAWEDQWTSWNISGVRAGTEGGTAGSTGLALAISKWDEQNVAVACSAPGRCLVAWDGFNARPALQSQRVSARALSAPSATRALITTPEDTAVGVTLAGTPAGAGLTAIVLIPAAIGTLSGTPPNLLYTPRRDWVGTDSFTFKVNDGTTDSAPATISVTVTAVNDAPAALGQVRTTAPGVPLTLSLAGVDVDGDALSFSLITRPALGTLDGTPPDLTYSPAPDFTGVETLSFVVSDGIVESAPATITVTVTAGATGGGGGTAREPPRGCGCSGSSGPLLTCLLLCLGSRRRAPLRRPCGA